MYTNTWGTQKCNFQNLVTNQSRIWHSALGLSYLMSRRMTVLAPRLLSLTLPSERPSNAMAAGGEWDSVCVFVILQARPLFDYSRDVLLPPSLNALSNALIATRSATLEGEHSVHLSDPIRSPLQGSTPVRTNRKGGLDDLFEVANDCAGGGGNLWAYGQSARTF